MPWWGIKPATLRYRDDSNPLSYLAGLKIFYITFGWKDTCSSFVKLWDRHHLLDLSALHVWLLECEDCAWSYGQGNMAFLWDTQEQV